MMKTPRPWPPLMGTLKPVGPCPIHAPAPPRRSISECITLLPEDSTATIDADFAKDVEAGLKVIASRSNHPQGLILVYD